MKKHYRKEQDCLNCGAHLAGYFCHVCGQENLEIKENFWHLMVESIGDYFHFDAKFFHTLKPLLFIPGKLTNDYNAGKRMQYLHPIRMYIFISLVFFILLFKYTEKEEKQTTETVKNEVKSKNPQVNMETAEGLDSAKKAITIIPWITEKQKQLIYKKMDEKKLALKDSASKKADKKDKIPNLHLSGDKDYASLNEYEKEQKNLPASKKDGVFKAYLIKKSIQWNAKGDGATEIILENFKHNLPKMMFILLPVYALILKVVFRRSKKFYVEHIIHSMHIHSFFFLFYIIIMLLGFIVPGSWNEDLQSYAFLLVLFYIYKSFRNVYHRSRFRTIVKMMGVGINYALAVALFVCMLAVISFTTM